MTLCFISNLSQDAQAPEVEHKPEALLGIRDFIYHVRTAVYIIISIECLGMFRARCIASLQVLTGEELDQSPQISGEDSKRFCSVHVFFKFLACRMGFRNVQLVCAKTCLLQLPSSVLQNPGVGKRKMRMNLRADLPALRADLPALRADLPALRADRVLQPWGSPLME